MTKLLYITSTLPYINGISHAGHLLEFLQSDALARYLKYKHGEKNVLFSTGLDEYGLKVYTSAKQKGIDTQEYCDISAKYWEDFVNEIHMKPDVFYRTTSEEHKKGVIKAWNICFNKGDIYEREYEGHYCVGCESFKTEKDLHENKCPDHPHLEIKTVKEKNYFFRLTKYRDHLLKWLEDNKDFLTPKSKYEELRNFILEIEDISVSRLKSSVPWGIEVPNNPEQTIYIWFTALLNYIISAGWHSDDNFNERWSNSIQLCGPDNLRFQAVIWQGILASLDLPQTKKLLVHGTVLDENGSKMSKSVGNVIDPMEQINKFGLTPVRFYTLGALPTYSNCSWSEKDIVSFYNAHLANNLGNLINRVITILRKHIELDELLTMTWLIPNEDAEFEKIVDIKKIEECLSNYEIKHSVDELNAISTALNQFITLNEPWRKERDECLQIISKIYYGLSKIIPYYKILLPEKSDVLDRVFYRFEKEIIFPRFDIKAK